VRLLAEPRDRAASEHDAQPVGFVDERVKHAWLRGEGVLVRSARRDGWQAAVCTSKWNGHAAQRVTRAPKFVECYGWVASPMGSWPSRAARRFRAPGAGGTVLLLRPARNAMPRLCLGEARHDALCRLRPRLQPDHGGRR